MRIRILLLCLSLLLDSAAIAQDKGSTAEVHVDAARVVNRISPRMYAAFTEMTADNIKRGLTAEMLLDRSFEQPPDTYGLPTHWNLEPDERSDNVGAITFVPTTTEA